MPAATAASSTSASLSTLLRDGAPAKEIETYLDGLSASARVEEVLGITGGGVKRLYEAVKGAPTVSIEEFLPKSHQGTLIYEGRNSLAAFSRFQKRFTRLEGGEVIGYNHQTMAFVTGPGYFQVREASGEGEHGSELYFDYTAPPPAKAPEGWPAFSPNDKGLSRLVYGHMIDYCRRVARGVVVGKAYKKGVDQKAYFTLSLP
ncbi:MAG: hypothetical protein ABI193_23270 [Minicystis sp.]